MSLVTGRLDWCNDVCTILLSVRLDLLLSLAVSWSWYRFLCGHETCVTTWRCVCVTSTNPPDATVNILLVSCHALAGPWACYYSHLVS